MNTETKEQIKNDLQQYVAKVGGQMAASRQLTGVSNGTISNINTTNILTPFLNMPEPL